MAGEAAIEEAQQQQQEEEDMVGPPRPAEGEEEPDVGPERPPQQKKRKVCLLGVASPCRVLIVRRLDPTACLGYCRLAV